MAYATIGRAVRRGRTTSQLSQEELGAAIGLTQQGVHAIESGRNDPPFSRLVDIAKTFSDEGREILADAVVRRLNPERKGANEDPQ